MERGKKKNWADRRQISVGEIDHKGYKVMRNEKQHQTCYETDDNREIKIINLLDTAKTIRLNILHNL